MMGADPSRWAPTTRETADHSLPYCVAIALLDGEVTAGSFASSRLQDPAVVSLMRKVKVSESPELSDQYPEAVPSRVSIHLLSGELLTTEVRYPTGHAKNPMNDAEVEKKFRGLFQRRGNATQCDEVLMALWALDEIKDFSGDVLRILTVDVGRDSVPAGVRSVS
jgi:2-methylcitrate dehydratase